MAVSTRTGRLPGGLRNDHVRKPSSSATPASCSSPVTKRPVRVDPWTAPRLRPVEGHRRRARDARQGCARSGRVRHPGRRPSIQCAASGIQGAVMARHRPGLLHVAGPNPTPDCGQYLHTGQSPDRHRGDRRAATDGRPRCLLLRRFRGTIAEESQNRIQRPARRSSTRVAGHALTAQRRAWLENQARAAGHGPCG